MTSMICIVLFRMTPIFFTVPVLFKQDNSYFIRIVCTVLPLKCVLFVQDGPLNLYCLYRMTPNICTVCTG
jgi:hypothetical protein